MSHITHVSVNLTDLDCLERAAEKCGMKLVRNSQTYKWYGKVLDKSAIPNGYTEAEMGTCDHELVVKGNIDAYSCGVVIRRDGQPGWVLHYDDFSSKGKALTSCIGENGHDIVQAYGVEVAKMAAMNAGYAIIGEEMVDGKCELLLSM